MDLKLYVDFGARKRGQVLEDLFVDLAGVTSYAPWTYRATLARIQASATAVLAAA
jgi:hypothetical protein